MERTRTFTFPDHTTRTIELPYGSELRTTWGSEERLEQYPSNLDAIEAYLDCVEAWLDEGAEQLGPWMCLCGPDGDEVAYRLRADRILSTRVDGVETHTSLATHKEHFEAMSRWIARYLARGYEPRFDVTWEDFEMPGAPWVEARSPRHRGFYHEDDANLEFGPELHLHQDGTTSNALYQVDSCFEGMRYGFSEKSGHALVFVDFGHRGQNVGMQYFLHPSGIPHMIKRLDKGFLYVFEDPSVDVWLADPSTEEVTSPSSSEDGHQTRTEERVAREEGRVVKTGHADGHEEVTIYYADSERVARRYSVRDGSFVGTLEVFDVTGERVKKISFPDVLDPLDGDVPIYELVPTLTQGDTMRVEIPYEETLRWWVGSRAHEQRYDNHALAAQACLELIKDWHSLGYVYQGPWIEWGDTTGNRMRTRLPVKSVVHTQQWIEGAWRGEPEEVSSHVEALDAYNRTIDRWKEQGMSLIVPEYNGGWARPAAHYAELVYTPLPEESEEMLLERRVHILAKSPADELRFGSQRETFDDGTTIDVPYLADTQVGWLMKYEQGKLRGAYSFLGVDSEIRGRAYTIDANDHVNISLLKIAGEQESMAVLSDQQLPIESITIHDDPVYASDVTTYFAEDTSQPRAKGKYDHDGARHGRWVYYMITGEIEGAGEFYRGVVSARDQGGDNLEQEKDTEKEAALPEGFEASSFNAQFGEVRSLLAEGIHTQYEADLLWLCLFSMSTHHHTEFFEVAEPYVRASGFLQQHYSVPMFRDWDALDCTYKGAQGEWIGYDDGDYFTTQQCYGVYLTHQQAALLGDPGDGAIMMRVEDNLASEEQKGHVLCGIDSTYILAQSSRLADKKKKCKAAFSKVFGKQLKRLGITERPSFYLSMRGYKICASLIYGPIEQIEDSEDKWPSELDGKGLDVIREHECYDQSSEIEGLAYRCAEIEWFSGQGLFKFELDAARQRTAKKKLSKAGHSSKKEYGYEFLTHM